jgi:hypothetical protein
MGIVQQADDKTYRFSEGFIASYDNLLILEDGLSKKEKLQEAQYANYLSHVVFCIELGMKTIININDTIEKKHGLKYLYNKMPDVFHKIVEKKSGNSKLQIDSFFKLIENIFVKFRYMDIEHLIFFLKGLDNENNKVKFSEAINFPNYLFIRNLLKAIMNYYYCLKNNLDENLLNSIDWEKDYNAAQDLFHEELKRCQFLDICLAEFENCIDYTKIVNIRVHAGVSDFYQIPIVSLPFKPHNI